MKAKLNNLRLASEVAKSRMSQNRWAQKLGFSKGHFSELVNGRHPYPSAETRRKLLEGFELSFEELFEIQVKPADRPHSGPPVAEPRLRPFIEIGTDVARPSFWRDGGMLMAQQVRVAARSLKNHYAFASFVVIILGLGIGLTTAVFSVVDSVLIEPLPYQHPDRLVAIFRSETGRNSRSPSSPADFVDYKRELSSIEGMIAAHPWAPVWTRPGRSERVTGLKATSGLFELLGVPPLHGYTPQNPSNGDQVVILGYEMWVRDFGADPGVVGQTITLDRQPYSVVAVMPAGFYFPPFWATEAEFWVPLQFSPEEASRRNSYMLRIFGRLTKNRSLDQAQSELNALISELRQQFPDSYRDMTPNVELVLEPTVGGSRKALWFLALSVGLVLAVACANVANLLIARTLARRREIATRQALGASARQLIGQFLVEGLMLTTLGCFAGLIVAFALVDLFSGLGVDSLPRSSEIAVDWTALMFSALVAGSIGLVFGLTPAFYVRRLNLESALRVGGRWDSGSEQIRSRKLLVIAQLALAVALLFGAGLFLRSFQSLAGIDPGFRQSGLLTYTVSLSGTEVESVEEQRILFGSILDDIRSMPEVASAALINHLPIGGDIWQRGFTVAGTEPEESGRTPSASFRVAVSDYFPTMDIPLMEGDYFRDSIAADSPIEILINETLANRYFPEKDAVGSLLSFGGDENQARIVGVVGDVRQWALTDEVRPEIYYSYSQNPVPWFLHSSLIVEPRVQTSGELLQRIRRRIWEVDSRLAVSVARPMESILSSATASSRLQSLLIAMFAIVALSMSGVGVYGVLAYLVGARRQEFGLRIALGAQPSDIQFGVVRSGAFLGLLGLGFGTLGAIATGQLASSELYEVQLADPVVLAGVFVFLTGALLLACWIPARRATRIDPLSALRSE